MAESERERPLTRKEKDDQDDLLSALTVMATKKPRVLARKKKPKPKVKIVENKIKERKPSNPLLRSPVFYEPSKSFSEEVNDTKEITVSPDLELMQDDIAKRAESYLEELPPKLSANVDKLREFFLKDIAPLTLAAQTSTFQAQAVLQEILGAPITDSPFPQFERMVSHASRIRMAQFVARYMGLTKSDAALLLDAVTPKPQSIVFPVDPFGDRRQQKQSGKQEPNKD